MYRIVLLVALALGLASLNGCKRESDAMITGRIIAKENSFTKVSMIFLGKYLGEHFKGKKLVVLLPIFSGDTARDKMQLDALKEGIDGRLTVVVEKIGDDPGSGGTDAMVVMGPEGMVTAAHFNEAMEKHKDADVFLSLGGLPMDFTKMTFWTMDDEVRPAMALANANIYMLQKAIQSGMVSVVLHNNPEAVYDPKAPLPKDPQESFDQRYILIDKTNVAAIATKYPELFKEASKER